MPENGAAPAPDAPPPQVAVRVEVTVAMTILTDGTQRVAFRSSTDDPDLCFASLMAGLGAVYGKARSAAAAAVAESPIVSLAGVPFRQRT